MKFNQKAIKQLLSIAILSTVAIACTNQSDDFTVIRSANEVSEVNKVSDMSDLPIPIEGTVWNLVSYKQQQILPKSEITAEFKKGRVSGSAGCNRYFADYQLLDAKLNVNSVGSTKIACPDVDGLMEQETTYLRLLDKAQTATVENNQLTIKTDDGDLVFEAKQPIAIEGTVWNLVTYNQQQILPKSEITAEFKQGRVNGSAGCNRYFADYQLDNAKLNINMGGSTQRACPDVEGLMEQETAYLRLLDKAQTATVENNQLTIKTDDGDLVFEAAKNSAANN